MEIEMNSDLLIIMLLYNLPNNFENFKCAVESRNQLPDAELLRVKKSLKNTTRRNKRPRSKILTP